MSRKIIDAIAQNRQFNNYDLFMQLSGNPKYVGNVTKTYQPIKLDDPEKDTEPVYLVDLIMGGTEFPQNGSSFQFIGGDKTYELSKKDFKKVKALAVGQINNIEDVSQGIANAILWFNGECQEPSGSLLYTQVFKTAKQRLSDILNPEEFIEGKATGFESAINKMHG